MYHLVYNLMSCFFSFWPFERFLYLFEKVTERKRAKTERKGPSTGSFPRWTQQPGLDQTESRSFFRVSPVGAGAVFRCYPSTLAGRGVRRRRAGDPEGQSEGYGRVILRAVTAWSRGWDQQVCDEALTSRILSLHLLSALQQ